jgi:polar amino acid transport system substrate-binding protein
VALRSRLSATVVLCTAVAAAASLALAGCGATTNAPAAQPAGCVAGKAGSVPTPSPLSVTESTDATAAAKVPTATKSKGKLVIATDASYAPNEFTATGSNTIIGMDADLGTAIGKVLGLDVSFVNVNFDGILAGVQAGRYDLSLSSFTDTKEREQGVDFVTYFSAGTSIMVQNCDPKKINSVSDLCGKTVGAEAGTTQLDQLTKSDVDGSVVASCQKAGKAAPKGQSFPGQTDVDNALGAGRIDAYMADSPVVAYALKSTGGVFKKVGADLETAPYGIVVPKKAGTLKDAVQAAVQKLMDDGNYTKILNNWGVADGAITQAKINDAQY